jgi:hypothetical protein
VEKKEEGKRIATDGRTFLILDFGLHVVDGIAALHLKSDRLARQGLHKDLPTPPRQNLQTTKTTKATP